MWTCDWKGINGVNDWTIINSDWLWVALSAESIPVVFRGVKEYRLVCLSLPVCACVCVSPMSFSVYVSGCLSGDMCLSSHIKPCMPWKVQTHTRASRWMNGFRDCYSTPGWGLKLHQQAAAPLKCPWARCRISISENDRRCWKTQFRCRMFEVMLL